jgi:hypothetical protein
LQEGPSLLERNDFLRPLANQSLQLRSASHRLVKQGICTGTIGSHRKQVPGLLIGRPERPKALGKTIMLRVHDTIL